MIALVPYYFIILLLSVIWAQPILFISKAHKPINPLLLILTGILVMSIVAMLMVFGGAVNLSSQLLFLISSLAIAWLRKEQILQQVGLLIQVLKAWNFSQKMSFVFLAIPILYQSAQACKIHDNGAYYQQTILWMEQFGLVKGLANIYPALGLYSNWHALTALLDLNQMGLGSFHQINGLLMLVFLGWALNEYFVQQKLYFLVWTACNVCLGFFYLTAPSPDLPVLLFTGVLLYYFVKGFDPEQSILFAIFSLGIFLIKPPALIGLILGLYLLVINLKNVKNSLWIALIGFSLLGSFLYKNTVLSGYPMYPNQQPDLFELEWKVPKNWNTIYTKGIVSWGVSDTQQVSTWNQISTQKQPNRFMSWLSRTGYKGLMNKLLFVNCIVACISLLVCFKKIGLANKELFLLLALLIVGQYWEWLKLSQYRLMLPTGMGILFLWLTLSARFLKTELHKQWVPISILVALILAVNVLSFFPFQLFQNSSRNKQITSSTGFSKAYLLEPFHQFEYGPMSFIRIKGKTFYHYQQTKLTWNCSLPALSKSHHDFLLENLGYEVEMIGKTCSDGFKMGNKSKP